MLVKKKKMKTESPSILVNAFVENTFIALWDFVNIDDRILGLSPITNVHSDYGCLYFKLTSDKRISAVIGTYNIKANTAIYGGEK